MINVPSFTPSPDCGYGVEVQFLGITNTLDKISKWDDESKRFSLEVSDLSTAYKFNGKYGMAVQVSNKDQSVQKKVVTKAFILGVDIHKMKSARR